MARDARGEEPLKAAAQDQTFELERRTQFRFVSIAPQ